MQAARGYAPHFASPTQDQILGRMLAAAEDGAIAVLDLDGCLFDNRWRQVEIFHQAARLLQMPGLARVRAEHFRDWDLNRTMRNAGVSARDQADWAEPVRAFWFERFFDGAYCRFDQAMPSASAFVHRLRAQGATVVYLTGRDRGMAEGTLEALLRCGFPAPDGQAVSLRTKPRAATPDHVFKAQAIEEIRGLGRIGLCVDNEPRNVNLFATTLPTCCTVFIETDHSPREDRVPWRIPRIRSWVWSSVSP